MRYKMKGCTFASRKGSATQRMVVIDIETPPVTYKLNLIGEDLALYDIQFDLIEKWLDNEAFKSYVTSAMIELAITHFFASLDPTKHPALLDLAELPCMARFNLLPSIARFNLPKKSKEGSKASNQSDLEFKEEARSAKDSTKRTASTLSPTDRKKLTALADQKEKGAGYTALLLSDQHLFSIGRGDSRFFDGSQETPPDAAPAIRTLSDEATQLLPDFDDAETSYINHSSSSRKTSEARFEDAVTPLLSRWDDPDTSSSSASLGSRTTSQPDLNFTRSAWDSNTSSASSGAKIYASLAPTQTPVQKAPEKDDEVMEVKERRSKKSKTKYSDSSSKSMRFTDNLSSSSSSSTPSNPPEEPRQSIRLAGKRTRDQEAPTNTRTTKRR